MQAVSRRARASEGWHKLLPRRPPAITRSFLETRAAAQGRANRLRQRKHRRNVQPLCVPHCSPSEPTEVKQRVQKHKKTCGLRAQTPSRVRASTSASAIWVHPVTPCKIARKRPGGAYVHTGRPGNIWEPDARWDNLGARLGWFLRAEDGPRFFRRSLLDAKLKIAVATAHRRWPPAPPKISETASLDRKWLVAAAPTFSSRQTRPSVVGTCNPALRSQTQFPLRMCAARGPRVGADISPNIDARFIARLVQLPPALQPPQLDCVPCSPAGQLAAAVRIASPALPPTRGCSQFGHARGCTAGADDIRRFWPENARFQKR